MREFRVATFNLYNLVAPGFDYYRPGTAYSDEEFNDKTDWIARQLDEMQADIVGFQEVFQQGALATAMMKSRSFGGVTPVVPATLETQNPLLTPAVGLASRFPTSSVESIEDIPRDALLTIPGQRAAEQAVVSVPVRHFSRPILKARVQLTAELIVTFFVAHLKSKRPTYLEGETEDQPKHRTLAVARSLIRRSAEAAGLRSLIVSETRDNRHPVIVLGDVNDGTLAVTTQMIAGEQPFFRLRRDRKEPYWDVLLHTAQQLQAGESTRDTYFTHIYNGSYESLDHIMVSEEFYGRNPDRVGEVDYVRVFNDHIIDEMQSFDEIPRTRSDHGQVVVKIRLRA